MTTKEKIEFYTCHLEGRDRKMYKVIEVSDLEDIMETYHREQVKKLNIDDVSNCVHPHRNLSSGDEGLFCDKCQTYISKDSHIC